jgi:hypothetical protein
MAARKNKKGRRGKARASAPKRGSLRRKLSSHIGFDFSSYFGARAFALKAKKALTLRAMPEIRKVDGLDGLKKYVVVMSDPKTYARWKKIKEIR